MRCSQQHIIQWATRQSFLRGISSLAMVGRTAVSHGRHTSCAASQQEGQEEIELMTQTPDKIYQQNLSANQLFKYVAALTYDGSRYNGFQLQSGRTPTIQGAIERALRRYVGISREDLNVQGAARTDAGVHARAQAVHFYSHRELEPERSVRALNSLLPDDVRVLNACAVPLDFNVKYSLGKIYHYDIHLEPISDPFTSKYRHHARCSINIAAMEAAAGTFCGTHDFSAFCSKPKDGSDRDPVRTLQTFDTVSIPGGVRFVVEGRGFLYKQVRHIVGALLAVGEGRLGIEDIREALEGGIAAAELNRHGPKMYTVAEARGLCLAHLLLPPPADVLFSYQSIVSEDY